MLGEIINVWSIVYSYIQGFLIVFMALAKMLFTWPILPLTILSIAGAFIKRKAR